MHGQGLFKIKCAEIYFAFFLIKMMDKVTKENLYIYIYNVS